MTGLVSCLSTRVKRLSRGLAIHACTYCGPIFSLFQRGVWRRLYEEIFSDKVFCDKDVRSYMRESKCYVHVQHLFLYEPKIDLNSGKTKESNLGRIGKRGLENQRKP